MDDGDQRVQEKNAQTLEAENTLPSSGGGVPSSVVDQSFDRRVVDPVDRVDRSLDRVSEENVSDENENGRVSDEEGDTGYSPEIDDGSSEVVASPGRLTHEMRDETRDEPVLSDKELDSPQIDEEDTISQPIPFQMGLTPQEESLPEDELTGWYEASA